MADIDSSDWMDKTGVGVVGELTLDDGKKMVAEVVDFNEESNELIVRVISSTRTQPEVDPQDFGIPCSRILAFEPQARETQLWPNSDPCRGGPFLFGRFLLMTTIFLSMTGGNVALFILFLGKDPYVLQELSAINYTLFEMFFTFAAHNRSRRYLFTCPAVRPVLPSLLWRNLGFLLALFALQTSLMAARPSLPDWWNLKDQKGITPFEGVMFLLCFALGWTQVLLNRKLLERAHRDFSPEASGWLANRD